MSVYDKLAELGITLPPVATPAAAYLPFVQSGRLVFLSGHIARREGRPPAMIPLKAMTGPLLCKQPP